MILSKFIQLIKKNFKLLIRSKASALIVIFGPLLVILLLGLAFDNTNTYALNIGIFSDSYTGVINSFIDKLAEKEFNVVKLNTIDDCTQRIKEGVLHTCIIFPDDFSISGEDRKNEVTFYVDYSRINMVYLVLETLTSKISLRSKEISMELTNTLLTSLEDTRKEVFSKKPLLSQLLAKNEEISGRAGQVIGELDTLDFSFDVNEFGIADIKSKINEADIELASFRITSAKSKVSTAMSIASGLDGGDVIVSDLSTAYSYLSSAETEVKNDVNNTEVALDLVDSAYNKIKATSEKLITIEMANKNAYLLMQELQTNLGESLSSVTELKNSFDKIDNFIGSVQISGADEVVSPIKTNIKAVSSETTHLNLLFPSLIVLVVMFISILLATTLVMIEKHSPAYFRNFISPVSDFWFVISIYFTNMVIVLIQILIMVGISIALFKANFISTILEASVVLILITTVFTFIGMLIGYLFNSEETGTLGAISVGSLFLLLSNLIIPLESVPGMLREILSWNPFVVAESMLRKVIIYAQPLEAVQTQIMYMVSVSLVIFFLVMVINIVKRNNLLKGWGSLTPSKTKLALIPALFKLRKKSKKEVAKEKADKRKSKKFSIDKIKKAKKKGSGNIFFRYLR